MKTDAPMPGGHRRGEPQRLLTIKQTAAILGVSVKTLRRRIEAGALPVIRDGGVLRIHPGDLERFIQSHREGWA